MHKLRKSFKVDLKSILKEACLVLFLEAKMIDQKKEPLMFEEFDSKKVGQILEDQLRPARRNAAVE